MDLLSLFFICGLAGILQGATGFGFGLTALALLALTGDIKQVAIMLVLANLSLNLFIFGQLREHFAWDRLRPFVAGAILGVPLGVLGLVWLDVALLKHLLGLVLVAAAGQALLPVAWRKPWPQYLAGLPLGLFSGLLSGAFGTGGPPTVAYVASQGFSRLRYAAGVQVVLGISGLTRLGCLLAGGLLTAPLAFQSACAALGAVGGAWLGLGILKRLSDRWARIGVAGLLTLLGLRALLS